MLTMGRKRALDRLELEEPLTDNINVIDSDRESDDTVIEFNMNDKKFSNGQITTVKQFHAEQRQKELELKIKLAETLASSNGAQGRGSDNGQDDVDVLVPVGNRFSFSDANTRLRKFDVTDVDQYLTDFKNVCIASSSPRFEWCNLLSSVVTGKAAKAFNKLTQHEFSDYRKYCELILSELQITSDVHRLRFWRADEKSNESYAECGIFLQAQFNKWIDALNVNNDIDRLKEIIMFDQMYDGLNADLRMYLVDKEQASLVEAICLADAYAVFHRNTRGQTSRLVGGAGNKTFSNQAYKRNST